MWFQHVPTEKFNHVVPFPIFFTLRSCTALVQPVEEVQMRRLSEMPYKTGTHYSKVWGEPLGAVSKKTEVDNCPIQKNRIFKRFRAFFFRRFFWCFLSKIHGYSPISAISLRWSSNCSGPCGVSLGLQWRWQRKIRENGENWLKDLKMNSTQHGLQW